MAQQLRSRRFETRLDPHTDDLITAAADARGESRSAFVVKAARQAAEEALSEPTRITAEQALAVLLESVDDTQVAACPLLKSLKR